MSLSIEIRNCRTAFRPFDVFLAAMLACLVASPAFGIVVAEPYKEPGLYPTREYVNQNVNEHIDPFTGLLQYHYVDIFIPGNGGLDLKVQRSYTVPQDAVTWTTPEPLGFKTYAGAKWTMHFGRVLDTTNTNSSGACVPTTATTADPVFELPDGSRRILFPNINTYPLEFTTIDRWRVVCDPNSGNVATAYSPDGVRYTFGFRGADVSQNGTTLQHTQYVTEIRDRNNNTISISYRTDTAGNSLISGVSTSDGRSLTFAYQGENTHGVRLSTITNPNNGITWTYSYQQITGLTDGRYYQLTRVDRPDGTSWQYTYNPQQNSGVPGSYAMSRATYPQGGTIDYTYDYVQFDSNLNGIKNTVVRRRTSNPGGPTTYSYVPGSPYDTTTVFAPEATYTYQHFGYSASSSGTVWKIGLLISKSTGSVQTETYSWAPQQISTQQYDRGYGFKIDSTTQAPLLTQKQIVRDGQNYATTYSNFDTYGNPQSISESGNATRTNSLTYYSTTPTQYIIHQIKDENRSAGTINRTFNTNGNLLSETKYGVATSYGRLSTGDISSVTDANSHSTSYSAYRRGIPQTENRPENISLSRGVEDAGNVTSEIDGEHYQRTYTYDGLNRIRSIGMPAGSNYSIIYSANSRTVSRGSFTETTNYDGFGRPTTITRGGITTQLRYDPSGRKTFESYPGSSLGATYDYDVLGRVGSISFAGAGTKTFFYGGNSVTLTDERSKVYTYGYRSYGDPDERYLMSIGVSTPGATISISRNAADKITGVTQGSLSRTFGYDGRYFLTSETRPETTQINYTPDNVGNIVSKSYGSYGNITHVYDGLNRLTSITYPTSEFQGGTPSATFTYDGNNKLKTANSTSANRSFSYDANGNLYNESLTVNGLTFNTTYGFDPLDHLNTITYPGTGTVVTYSPDSLGRPATASPFLTSIQYYPSGNFSSLTYANTTSASFAEDPRQRPTSAQHRKGTLFTDLSYTYDNANNVSTIVDSMNGLNWTLGYDDIDRLTSASGTGGGNIGYDGNGNITTYNFGGINRAYSYTSNRLSSVSGTISRNFSYDSAGNVDGNGVSTFQYDAASNLRCVNCAGTSPITYGYDAKNIRVKTIKNGATTYSVYTAYGDLISEYDPVGSTYNEYVYLRGKVVARRLQSTLTPTTTQLVASPAATMINQPVTLTATVTGSNPTGSVSFKEGGTVLHTSTISGGAASWVTSFGANGLHNIFASYSGDSSNRASDSNTVTVNVGLGESTSTSLGINYGSCSGGGCGPSPEYGTQITFTATVSGATIPTGTVLFKNAASTIGQATLSGNTATYQTTTLNAGSYSVVAQYQGDATHQNSSSGATPLTVYKKITTTTVASSLNPTKSGQVVTFTGVVNGIGATGTMSFLDGSSTLGTPTLNNGSASFSTNALATGAHSITAAYGGDANNSSSTSSILSQVVTVPAPTTSTTSCTVSPVTVKNTGTVIVSVGVTGNNPTGVVTLLVDGAAGGTATLAAGAASFNLRGLGVGTRSVAAAYGGDAGNTSSGCSATNVQVTFDPALFSIIFGTDD